MTDPSTLGPFPVAVVLALAGFAFGLAYFRMVRWTARCLADGARDGGWAGPAALTLARVAAAVVLLILAARLGALALLAAFLGFLVARTVALRRTERTG